MTAGLDIGQFNQETEKSMALSDSHSFRFRLMVGTFIMLGLETVGTSLAKPIQHGTSAETSCEVVSVGQWLCTIDGIKYYCDTKTNPDPKKNCMPAKTNPSGPKSSFNQGEIKQQGK